MRSVSVPTVSVVIPVRNEAAGIRNCLDAILAQTVRPSEVIVLDSGSTDGTKEILAEYPDVTVLDIAPRDFNHGETRNAGCRASTSTWKLSLHCSRRRIAFGSRSSLTTGVMKPVSCKCWRSQGQSHA